ncbi:MAG: glycine zipper domain-containing protein [Phycisphaerales bacterium]|jgi:hypothetical protein
MSTTIWRRLAIALAMVPVAIMGGCNNGVQGAFSGAALGSLAGLGLGSLSGDAGRGAAAGAIIGGVGGAVLGDQNARASAYRTVGPYPTERVVERPVYVDRPVYVHQPAYAPPQPIVIYKGSGYSGHRYRYQHQYRHHYRHHRPWSHYQRRYDPCW